MQRSPSFGMVRVTGNSMTPTLRDGDRLLVRYGAPVRVGQVVLGHYRAEPDLAVVKRVFAPDGRSWSVGSDNPRAGSSSAGHGPAEVRAVAIRLWPTAPSRGRVPRLRRLLGYPIPEAPPERL